VAGRDGKNPLKKDNFDPNLFMDPSGFIFLFFVFILLVIALLILSLMLALYWIPLDIIGTAEKEDEILTSSISILWGVFGITVCHGDTTLFTFLLFHQPLLTWQREERAKNIFYSRAERKSLDLKAIVMLFIRLWPDIRAVITALVRSLVLRRFECEIVYGTTDAALTGRIFGYCSALLPAQFFAEDTFIDIIPVFGKNLLNGRISISIRVERLLFVLIPVLKLITNQEMRGFLGDLKRGDRGYA
jgi:hypothetical protein